MINSPTSSQPPAGAALGRGRLLVVDDDRLVLATLVQGLEDAGYEVIDADNGDDAILLARQHRPDLALLDIRMDGLSGFDVAAYLRDHLHIPFMFLSAFSDAATLAKIHALGALASLVKPLDLEQIVPAVATAHAQALRLRAQAGTHNEATPAVAVTKPAGAHIDAVEAAGAAPMVLGLSAAPARGAGSAAGFGTGAGVGAAPLDPGRAALQQPVAIALGIVMHRYSLKRGAALARLEQLAHQEGRGLVESCAAFVAALEQLSLPD